MNVSQSLGSVMTNSDHYVTLHHINSTLRAIYRTAYNSPLRYTCPSSEGARPECLLNKPVMGAAVAP